MTRFQAVAILALICLILYREKMLENASRLTMEGSNEDSVFKAAQDLVREMDDKGFRPV
jgi:hypothetical protein